MHVCSAKKISFLKLKNITITLNITYKIVTSKIADSGAIQDFHQLTWQFFLCFCILFVCLSMIYLSCYLIITFSVFSSHVYIHVFFFCWVFNHITGILLLLLPFSLLLFLCTPVFISVLPSTVAIINKYQYSSSY